MFISNVFEYIMIVYRFFILTLLLLISAALSATTYTFATDLSELENAIAQADESKARQISLQCVACHSVEEGAQEVKLGPNLWGVINRPIAGLDDYDYSPIFLSKEGVWDNHLLDEFLSSPNNFASGTKMLLPGISDLNTRAHIIRYLHSLNANPKEFNQVSSKQSTLNVADPFGDSWPAGAGREKTGYACIVCHSLAIVKQQGQTNDGWSELIDYMIEEHGMSDLGSNDRQTIVNYLATHFNIDSRLK